MDAHSALLEKESEEIRYHVARCTKCKMFKFKTGQSVEVRPCKELREIREVYDVMLMILDKTEEPVAKQKSFVFSAELFFD